MGRVLLGVTGGIAAYKACELTRLLVRAGHDVTPILTPDAERFVAAQTFEALARREMPRELYPHLVEADLLVIAPLSANTLAKLAQGLADNVLTQTALAFDGPALVAPAMNPRMWSHATTQENIETLRRRGVELIGPGHGDTAEGDVGVGRMTEPEEIFERCVSLLEKRDQLRGRRVLVTAGGMRELGAGRNNGAIAILVGFAADVGERGLERAGEKLATKEVDLIVFNDVSREDIGFDAADNEVVLVSADGERRLEKASKERIAAAILDAVAERLGA